MGPRQSPSLHKSKVLAFIKTLNNLNKILYFTSVLVLPHKMLQLITQKLEKLGNHFEIKTKIPRSLLFTKEKKSTFYSFGRLC
jgi:hypothetical protein